MSYYKISKIISRELNHLNAMIDLKIIKGESYKKEARRHKFLLSQLMGLSKPKSIFASFLF